MIEEYCHVKTTPNMPIRLAVRMSMSIPGLYVKLWIIIIWWKILKII